MFRDVYELVIGNEVVDNHNSFIAAAKAAIKLYKETGKDFTIRLRTMEMGGDYVYQNVVTASQLLTIL